MDNTNHDLVHTLSVRLDAGWHDVSYRNEVDCEGCRRVFERLYQIDEEAVSLLSTELAEHVRLGHFPSERLVRA